MSRLSFLTGPAVNGKTCGSRALRRAAVLPVVAAVAVLATGCDVVHVHFGSSGASASPGSVTFQPTLAFVQCMHNHGLKTFPNPSPGKSVTLQLTGNSPIVRGYDACKHLLPGASATAPATASPPGAVPADCLALRPPCFRPQQFRTAYGIQPLLDRGITGHGQTVVLLEFPSSATGSPSAGAGGSAPANTDVRQDLARFDSVFGLPAARLQVVNTLAHAASPWLAAGPVGTEEVLDTEIVHALAPDAAIREVLIPSSDTASPDTVAAALAAAMRLGLAQHPAVMSLSIGAGEQCFTPAVTARINSVLQTAQRDRVTVVVGTGDSGAATTVCPGPGPGPGPGGQVPPGSRGWTSRPQIRSSWPLAAQACRPAEQPVPTSARPLGTSHQRRGDRPPPVVASAGCSPGLPTRTASPASGPPGACPTFLPTLILMPAWPSISAWTARTISSGPAGGAPPFRYGPLSSPWPTSTPARDLGFVNPALYIACAPGGLSLTWSEVIFSDAPTVLDILRPREVRDALLTR